MRAAWLLALAMLVTGCGGGGGGDPDASTVEIDAAPGNPTLAALTSSLGALEPPFEPQVLAYDLRLAVTDAAVTLTPVAAVEAGTTITIGDVEVASGTPALQSLLPGVQELELVVTTEDGSTTTYLVRVHRGEPGIALWSEGGELPGRLTPVFAPSTTSYTVGLGIAIQRLQLAVIPPIAGSTIAVNGGPVIAGATSAPITLNYGNTPINVVVTPPGGNATTFMLAVNRGGAVLQQAYAKASNTDAEDTFGVAVAIHGNTMVVGALGESSSALGVDGDQTDDSGGSTGAAYVFVRTGTTWTQQAYLKASNAQAGDLFGRAVAVQGDTIAVGSLDASSATGIDGNQGDNTREFAGAVYVFTRTGTTWSQQAYVKASNTDAHDSFGGALALEGDTLAVGARFEESAATGVNGDQSSNAGFSGAVYVFARAGTTWSQQAYLKASNTGVGDGFGGALAMSGNTLVVGAPGEDSSATGVNGNQADNSRNSAGAAYVFTRTGTIWSQQAYLKASNTDEFDQFGASVAVWGDTSVVGAPGEQSRSIDGLLQGAQADNFGTGCGAVYVFSRAGTTWGQQRYLKASNTDLYDNFGSAVALWGQTLAIGATGEASAATGVGGDQASNTAMNAGAVYLWTLQNFQWTQLAYLKASNTGAQDIFGAALALWGDTLAIGAYGESSQSTGIDGDQANDLASRSGAVYVLR